LANIGTKIQGIRGSASIIGGATGVLTQASGVDPAAAAYFTAAGITDATEQAAVIQLVADLKGEGSTTNNNNIWTKMNTIYPVSPTSLAAAAFNLKDASSFEITWANSPTHATTGVTGNGSTQYGDTGYNVSTYMTENNFGATYSGNYTSGYAMGVLDGDVWGIRCVTNTRLCYAGAAANNATVGNNTRQIITVVRDSNTNRVGYADGTAGTPNTTNDTGSLPNYNMYVLGRNNAGAAGSFAAECDFWAIHQALTAGEAKDLSDAISTYNANVILGGR
jgi:hypothetical protein